MLHTEAVENKSTYIFKVLEWNPLNPTLSARKATYTIPPST